MNRIEELKEQIKAWDKAYRIGESIASDLVYDDAVDELISLIGEDDEFFNNSIKEDYELSNDRRELLPEGTIMASMNKIKTIDDLNNWIRLKNIPLDSEFVITPKYDAISLLKNEETGDAWTRGGKNAKGGLKSKKHLIEMKDVSIPKIKYSYGECIISRKNFKKLIFEKNEDLETNSARNISSGFFRSDEVRYELQYVDFIRYGIFDEYKKFNTKQEILNHLNNYQKIKVPYKINKIEEITESHLQEIYKEFSQDYEIDGLIIEINNLKLCNELGREKSGNPKYAVAFKSSLFDERKITKVLDVEWGISKTGTLIPVCVLKDVNLGGVNINHATMNNALYLKNMGANKNSIVEVTRSGGVIPLVTKVIEHTDFIMPDNIECYWDGVHLKTVHETDEQKKKKLFAFFNILGVENVSDKTFDLLFDSGYKTIKDILSMSKKQFLKLERFGDRKAEIVYNGIHSKMNGVELCKLQYASGFFSGLGSKKLILLEHFETTPTLEEILKVDGFSDISANIYLNGLEPFNSFYNEIKQFVTIKKIDKIIMENNKLEGMTFVFTGYRDKIAEVEIQKQGGRVTTSVSKNTNFLVMKEKGSSSSKELKALELGVTVLDAEELAEMLK